MVIVTIPPQRPMGKLLMINEEYIYIYSKEHMYIYEQTINAMINEEYMYIQGIYIYIYT